MDEGADRPPSLPRGFQPRPAARSPSGGRALTGTGRVIRSAHNPLFRRFLSAEREGLVRLDGPHLIEEALVAGVSLQLLAYTEDFGQQPLGQRLLARCSTVPSVAVTPALLAELGETVRPAGVVALAQWRAQPAAQFWEEVTRRARLARQQPLLLVADAIQDPGNLGTMIRTAVAAGAHGLVLLPGTVHPGNSKVLRASAGLLFRFPWTQASVSELAPQLAARGIDLWVAEADGAQWYDRVDLRRQTAVVVANEGHGPTAAVRLAATGSLAIPLENQVESLNAGMAAAIILFEAARQRRQQVCQPLG